MQRCAHVFLEPEIKASCYIDNRGPSELCWQQTEHDFSSQGLLAVRTWCSQLLAWLKLENTYYCLYSSVQFSSITASTLSRAFVGSYEMDVFEEWGLGLLYLHQPGPLWPHHLLPLSTLDFWIDQSDRERKGITISQIHHDYFAKQPFFARQPGGSGKIFTNYYTLSPLHNGLRRVPNKPVMADLSTARVPPSGQPNPELGEICAFADKLLQKFVTETEAIIKVVNVLSLHLDVALG